MARVQISGVSMRAAMKYVMVMLGLIFTVPTMASGSSGPKMAEGVNYIPLEPALVVNYGGPGKSRFIRVELSLRAENAADATEIMHHLPLIRDRLVTILSAQTEEMISTAGGKEYLRVYALAEINKALLKVVGHSHDGHEPNTAEEKNKAATKPHAVAHSEEAATDAEKTVDKVLPSAADVAPVKGPASDLFFNNFIVQK